MAQLAAPGDCLVSPDPDDPRLTRAVDGIDQTGSAISADVVEERPLTIYLNSREIVTTMTIGDYPELLALGFLANQNMLAGAGDIRAVQYDDELGVVSVHTHSQTDFEAKLAKRTRTSGCAVGTVFGDMMEGLEGLRLPSLAVHTSEIYALSAVINRMPSLYLKAGAIHGCVLCCAGRPLVFMEDVGRHNAVDKIAGWMLQNSETGADKLLYTTGRLTSEMVMKAALMGIPALVSRSGFTAWGVELARQVGLTMIGRSRGQRFLCLSGQESLIFDSDPETVAAEPAGSNRKAAQ